ncbi:lipid-A-disaccharide synthase [Maricaulis salignorans]|uniref:Lipid-A-disaccharide synthase n=1 Tax=Maricaulis salignorans TaxID=144026 RepID=A0A1G9VAB6_9PROT|nr:lipid-A-disaccharide synthase [Maricaulis salignorans]SDM69134.1 lipid-A-disaccharide synthase [Maricaulis salignorans]
MTTPLVYIVAAERSGELLGADLIRSLRKVRGDSLDFAGVGGAAMAAEGVPTAVDIDGLAIIGWIDGLLAFRRVKERVALTVADILARKPDVVVLIDSWGFMLRVAQGVRAADPSIKLIKYVGPQVFATRPGRAKTLAATVDHLLSIVSFDAPFYTDFGLPVTFVGNPTLERMTVGDGAAFRASHGLDPDAQAMLVLFGSRPAEIRRMYDVMVQAIERILRRQPALKIVIVVAEPVAEVVQARLQIDTRMPDDIIIVSEAEKADAFAAVDLALACSGTVITELATTGVPTVAAYRLGWITWALIRMLNVMKSPYTTLVNMASDSNLVLEHVQTRCTAPRLAASTQSLLDSPERRRQIGQALRQATDEMRGEGKASDRAAEVVLQYLPRA